MPQDRLRTLFDYDAQRIPTVFLSPPSIMPVVMLCGSDHEMGFQYGQQAAAYIDVMKDTSWASVLEDQEPAEVRESLRRLSEYAERYTPWALEQMQGICEGAASAGYEISFDDVLVINCVPKKLGANAMRDPGVHEESLRVQEGCSVFAAWGAATADGRLVFGDSKDSVFNHQVAIVAFPRRGHNFTMTVRAGELGEHMAMNNRGLYIGTGLNPANREIDLGYGLHKAFSLQHMLRFADDACQAKDMFQSWEFPTATNLTFADTRGNAFVAERTAAADPVRKPGDFGERDFIYSTNNVLTGEMKAAVQGTRFVDHAGWVVKGSAIPRSVEVWNMLENYHGQIDADFVTMMWRFNDDPDPLSLSRGSFVVEQHQKICHHENMRVAVGLPDDGDKGVVHICTGPARRMLHPPTPRHRDCFQIAGTHTFFELSLASDPVSVVRAARNKAHDRLAEADFESMRLKYSDSAYPVLAAIQSQATAEYYDGVQAYNRGCLSEGNERLLEFARAATALTRCQAHARQVTEALVDPPTKPTDLSLQQYGGPWGKWAAPAGLPV